MKRRGSFETLLARAEAAAGSIRQVADFLEEIEESLPGRDKSRRLLLHQNAERLRAAAALLVAETAASGANAHLVGRVAASALFFVGGMLTPMAQGGVEGASSAVVGRALEANDRALGDVQSVESASHDALSERVDAEVEALRVRTLSLGRDFVGSTGAMPPRDLESLYEPDLGLINARQRLVALRTVIEQLNDVELDSVRGASSLRDGARQLRLDVQEVRRDVELLAEFDESLYPPQPVTDW